MDKKFAKLKSDLILCVIAIVVGNRYLQLFPAQWASDLLPLAPDAAAVADSGVRERLDAVARLIRGSRSSLRCCRSFNFRREAENASENSSRSRKLKRTASDGQSLSGCVNLM